MWTTPSSAAADATKLRAEHAPLRSTRDQTALKHGRRPRTMLAANNPLAGRVTVVVAAAGYGKTRAVRAWLGAATATWHRGPEIAAPPRSVQGITVLDDAHLAPNAVLAAWLAAGHPVVLITRRAL